MLRLGGLVLLLRNSRSSGLGLRAGAKLRLRAVLQEQEKLPGRQGQRAGAE